MQKKIIIRIFTIFLFTFTGLNHISAQSVTKKDYQRANQFQYRGVDSLVYRMYVRPHWAENKPVFWYSVSTRKGHQYYMVNAKDRKRSLWFDQKKIAMRLSKIWDEDVRPYHLPLRYLDWNADNHTIEFNHDHQRWIINLKTLEVSKIESSHHRSYHRLSSTSPNGKWTVKRKKYDLYLFNNETDNKTQLTSNGDSLHIYGARLPWVRKKEVGPRHKNPKPYRLRVSWSKDSHYFYAPQLDISKAKKMYLLQNTPPHGFRSQVYSYYRALPVDDDSVAKTHPYVFDVQKKQKTPLKMAPFNQISNGSWRWKGEKGHQQLYNFLRERGFGTVTLERAMPNTGVVDTLFHRSSDTYIDRQNSVSKFLPKSNELLWLSERDGWNQIYLYNLTTGEVKNKVTIGHYVVKNILHVDSKNRRIFFTAGGAEKGQDPYYNHLYSIKFDGSDFRSLTPENATHDVSLSPDQHYIVDRYSRTDQKPKTVLRDAENGKVLIKLEEADIKDLRAVGWRYPTPFKLKARDDSTNIYGIMYQPFNLKKNKKYPIVDYIYAGPQAVITPKSFSGGLRNSQLPFAQLGFIVFSVDGLGTAQRSKKFHDVSYKNIGDISLPEQVKTIKTLAQRYSFIDTSRVGIWGHSAGGYDAARAMFLRPDIFKVGVAESGDHDLRVAKAWWPELYMDHPAGPWYEKQSNMNIVDNLKGHLLLAHGNMDTNVHPAETFRLARSLIKAGRDFDMFIIPNVSHGYGYATSYFTRYRWNYFIKYLMGAKPLRNYQMSK